MAKRGDPLELWYLHAMARMISDKTLTHSDPNSPLPDILVGFANYPGVPPAHYLFSQRDQWALFPAWLRNNLEDLAGSCAAHLDFANARVMMDINPKFFSAFLHNWLVKFLSK